MTVDLNMCILHGTDGRRYILPSYIEGIYGAMNFMRKVIYEKELFGTAYKTISGREMTTTSSLGKHLKFLCSYKRVFSKDYKFSPLIEFFFEEYRKHPIKNYLPPLHGYDLEGVAMFDDFVATMRKTALKINLKKYVADWESKPKKNSKRLIEFEKLLFDRTARVMAVRLDLYYHKATFTPAEIDKIMVESAMLKERDLADLMAGNAISTPRVIEGRIALEEVQKDRKRLFTNMKGKPSLFKHLVGTVWVIEFSRTAGFHLHLFLGFDGAYVQKHEHIAQEVGEYWRDVISQGRGYFENCNRKKQKYGDDWALGEINHWDTVKREKLRNALQYFCKTNQMVQVIPYAGCQLFGCGFVHQQRKVRGGRPRIKSAIGAYQPRL